MSSRAEMAVMAARKTLKNAIRNMVGDPFGWGNAYHADVACACANSLDLRWHAQKTRRKAWAEEKISKV
jgi:hypothetical protein